VGGTFTDLAAVGLDGMLHARKVLSTPGDQSEGVERALAALGALAGDVERVVHGTTVVTNLLLERAGARVVLCATAGATDLLTLRRQERAALYDLAAQHPPPLVAAEDVIPVPERVTPDGVERALSPAAAGDVARAVTGRAPDIVAVCLLHAYADPGHERLLAEAIAAAAPGLDVVLASDVLPEIREYERTATVTAEAYARPAVARYLHRLAGRLQGGGYPAPAVMTSGGGLRRAADATRAAASLALSGPAGGIVGAALVARAAGFERALTIDIGGTSADVGLVLDGEPLVEAGGRVAGVPIALPRVLVETVSAGGGSLLWVDDGGALRVGPRSAGAEPGPAAFGRGGARATVTDAHVVLRNIRADRLSGGVHLDAGAAGRAVRDVAQRLGTDGARVAAAAIAAADAEMARALRRVSVERGVDPRGCVLVAFGGGGPLHACGLADRLGMQQVLIPPHAGVLSAVGLALGAERREALASVVRSARDLDAGAVGALAAAMCERAGPGEVRRWWARARYRGQGYELEVPFAPGDDGAAIAARFAAVHDERFGFSLDRPVEVVSARHNAAGHPRGATLARAGRPAAWNPESPSDDGGLLDVVVRGRATVTLPDATLLVAEGWTARALPIGGWLLERDP
jgi:N-methylhydantoinase A